MAHIFLRLFIREKLCVIYINLYFTKIYYEMTTCTCCFVWAFTLLCILRFHGSHFLFLFSWIFFFILFQIMISLVLPKYLGSSGANYAKNLLRTSILIQYLPRLYRFLPSLAGQSPSGFIFESAWANFVINLLTFVLSGHVVGSCWYLFGLQVGNCYFNV